MRFEQVKRFILAKKLFGIRAPFSSNIWQTTSKKCTKMRSTHEARLFSPIQPIRSLFSGVAVAVAVIVP